MKRMSFPFVPTAAAATPDGKGGPLPAVPEEKAGPAVAAEAPSDMRVDTQNGESDESRANWLYFHMFSNVFGICLLLQARPSLMLDALKGDKIRLATMMARVSAGVGVTELFLNPIAGQLSDRHGRRPLLILSPLINCLNKLLVAVNPSLWALAWERVVNGAVTTLAGSTTCAAALSDMFSGERLGLSFAKLGSAAGMGALTGSFMSGRLLAAGFTSRSIYAIASAVALAQFGVDCLFLQETLPAARRSTKPLKPPNPFAAAKLLKGSRGLKTLVAVAVLQCMPEGKNLSDLLMAYQTNEVGFSAVDRANFTSLFGSSMLFGGALAKHSIAMFGDRGHTSVTNLLTILALLIWGTSQRKLAAWVGLLVLFPTVERRCVTSAMSTDLAVSEGWNKGEYAAAFANVRALTVISAPLLYSSVYAACAPRGKAGYAFYASALTVALAEYLHRSLRDDECRPRPRAGSKRE